MDTHLNNNDGEIVMEWGGGGERRDCYLFSVMQNQCKEWGVVEIFEFYGLYY